MQDLKIKRNYSGKKIAIAAEKNGEFPNSGTKVFFPKLPNDSDFRVLKFSDIKNYES